VAIGIAKRFLFFRILIVVLLLVHFITRTIFPQPSALTDLLLFNLIAFLAALSAFYAPLFNDPLATTSLSAGIGLWAMGSTISSWNSFISFHVWDSGTNYAYALFYPLALFGMVRALSTRRKVGALELLDVIIVALGITTLFASLLLRPAMLHLTGSEFSVFLSILYPIGDCVLVVIALLAVLLQPKAMRSLIMLCGISIFAATDLYFLWRSATTGYPFASLVDDGWLLGLLVIAESLWHPGGSGELSERVTSVGATIALIASAAILGIAAVHPHYFPIFALIPALITITLAFLRMSVALREARLADNDRELARIDELTGIANRRRLLAEIELLGRKEGTLLLLDLDGFKKINDSMGHAAGDYLLKEIAIRFSRVLSHGALLARLGGDEFGVIVYGPEELGIEMAHALRATLSYPISLPAGSASVGVSIGRVRSDGKGELLKRADAAMYEAKRSGAGIVLARSNV
jgi:diguanylate cyclase (GGDEF)-like protein